MDKEIKIEIKDDNSSEIYNHLNEWRSLIESQKEDKWTETIFGSFKNLKLKDNGDTLSLNSLTFIYDEWKEIHNCPKCTAELFYEDVLGLYKCTECEWEGQIK